jgi:hypothetical protein
VPGAQESGGPITLGLRPVIAPATRLEVGERRRPAVRDGIDVVPLEPVSATAPVGSSNALEGGRRAELERGARPGCASRRARSRSKRPSAACSAAAASITSHTAHLLDDLARLDRAGVASGEVRLLVRRRSRTIANTCSAVNTAIEDLSSVVG